MVIDPCLMINNFSCWPFWAFFNHSSLNQMQTCHQTCTFYHTFPFVLFSYFSIKILFLQKIYVVHQGLFVTYLYVYVHDNIFKDNYSKFVKSPNPHSQRVFGNCVESTWTVLYYVPLFFTFSSRNISPFKMSDTLTFVLYVTKYIESFSNTASFMKTVPSVYTL